MDDFMHVPFKHVRKLMVMDSEQIKALKDDLRDAIDEWEIASLYVTYERQEVAEKIAAMREKWFPAQPQETPPERTWYDPPEGWRYGFPKPAPEDVADGTRTLEQWLRDEGVPIRDYTLNHTRMWYDSPTQEQPQEPPQEPPQA